MSSFGTRLAALAIAVLVIAPDAALACAVCSAGRDDETRAAFIGTTVLLSVLPLALIGGMAWWVRRRSRALAGRAGAPREQAPGRASGAAQLGT